ncbi:Golgi apparatus membrane protein TVP23-like protein A isoform 2 precursor, partial [Daubentonia madagascariensis]
TVLLLLSLDFWSVKVCPGDFQKPGLEEIHQR